MNTIDLLLPTKSFVNIRSAVATYLIIFNARRGGEPVRLRLHQWQEALDGIWVEKQGVPDDFGSEMLITFQTGKVADHLLPVLFPPETFTAMKFLTNKDIRNEVSQTNDIIFASTQKSESQTSGWHCINEILKRISLKGAINATRNRHRVASLLAALELSEKENNPICKHFGHSASVNENLYQSTIGTMQLGTTGTQLLKLHTGKTLPNNEQQPSTSKSSEETSTTTKDKEPTGIQTNVVTANVNVEANKRRHRGKKKSNQTKVSTLYNVCQFVNMYIVFVSVE